MGCLQCSRHVQTSMNVLSCLFLLCCRGLPSSAAGMCIRRRCACCHAFIFLSWAAFWCSMQVQQMPMSMLPCFVGAFVLLMGCLPLQQACAADAVERADMLSFLLSWAAFWCCSHVQQTPVSVLPWSCLSPMSCLLPFLFVFVLGCQLVQQPCAAVAGERAANVFCLVCHGLPVGAAGMCSRCQCACC
jgi:hypothetical protein